METLFKTGSDAGAVATASNILRSGGLVAFPTETVYGLGADALNADAAAKIYAAKGRPSDNPLIVHIADTSDVYKLASSVPDKAKLLMEAFWPGPLTIVLPKKSIVPDGTTGGLNTVAIRMPSHPVALSLIRESGVFIAAPSANTSGRPSPTTAEHVADDMNGRIAMLLDGGAVGIGIESTIVDCTGNTPAILRLGFITKAMIENIIGEVSIDPAIIRPDPSLRPKAPGMKYTHYAPNGELAIVEKKNRGHSKNDVAADESVADERLRIADKINEMVAQKKAEGFTVAVIATEETKHLYECENILIAGHSNRGETVAAKLYAVLRECDDLGADYIYSESFGDADIADGELGAAIMNRLLKAAGQRVIHI